MFRFSAAADAAITVAAAAVVVIIADLLSSVSTTVGKAFQRNCHTPRPRVDIVAITVHRVHDLGLHHPSSSSKSPPSLTPPPPLRHPLPYVVRVAVYYDDIDTVIPYSQSTVYYTAASDSHPILS